MIQKSMLTKEITQKSEWDEAIGLFQEKDIYFTYDYMQPFRKNGDGEPILFYFESYLGKAAYPFMYRDIAESAHLKGKIPNRTYFDISGVYGYGGPLVEVNPLYDFSSVIEILKHDFQEIFSAYCKEKGIVSQFDRFHPLLNTHEFFADYCTVTPNKKTICLDLKSVEFLTQNLTSGCRNKIRQAEKNGITVVVNDRVETLEAFKQMYHSTMTHNQASDYYFFNPHFFDDIKLHQSSHLIVANAYYQDKIIASALILSFDHFLHHHFSGSLSEYRHLKPNNLLFYEIAKWGSEQGYQSFHLGGGHESEGDSLFRFKKSFSKSEPKDFYIGKKLHDPVKSDFLAQFAGKFSNGPSDYFPIYRS